MARNYVAIHYIHDKLKGFDSKFIDCVTRCFNFTDHFQLPDGCLSNSVALYICAKKFGYNPTLCYGLCRLEEKEFYHVWLDIEDTIIDIGIYGNVNFNPLLSNCHKLDTPYIGSYENRNIYYGKFEFNENWRYSQIYQAEGKTFEEYMDGLPHNTMWKIVCDFLDKAPTRKLINNLRNYVKNERIERK